MANWRRRNRNKIRPVVRRALADLRGRLSIFDGTEDCGASCIFVSVNDLRAIVALLPKGAGNG